MTIILPFTIMTFTISFRIINYSYLPKIIYTLSDLPHINLTRDNVSSEKKEISLFKRSEGPN